MPKEIIPPEQRRSVLRDSAAPSLFEFLRLGTRKKKQKAENGGAYRDRTDDLNAASVALSQLS